MNTVTSEKTVARLFLVVFFVSLAGLWLCRAFGVTNGIGLVPSLFLFLIAPGFIPAIRIGRKLQFSFLEMLPLAASLSLGQAALLLLVFDWIGLSVFNTAWALPACTLAWYVWIELSGSRGTEFGAASGVDSAPGCLNRGTGRLLYLVLPLFLIAVSVLVLRAGTPLQWQTDSPAHLAAIRGVVEEDRVFPETQPYGPNGVVRPDPRFGIFHALCALLYVASGTGIGTLWKSLPAFFTPLLALGLFSVTRSLTGNVGAAFAAAFLFPLCYGGIGGGGLRTIGYPNRVSMLPYFVSLAVLFKYLRVQRKWLLVLLGILAVTTVAVHVYYFIEFLFVVTCFFLLKALLSRADARPLAKFWVRVVGATIGISLLFLVYRFLSSYSTANPYSVEGQNLLYLNNRFYVLNPFKAYGWFGLAGTVSFLLLPYFLVRARKSDAHAFVGAATAGSLLLIFNPLAMPIASKVLSYLAWRLMWAVPYVLSLAMFVTEFPSNIRRSSPRNRVLSCVGMGLVVAALLGTLNWRIDFYKHEIRPKLQSFPEDFAVAAGTLERFDKEVTGRRVFLSDPVTAYAIPAFTRHFVTAIPVAHSAPTDSFPVSRVRAALDVLNPSVGLRRTVDVLRKYGVEYVVVNTGFCEKLSAFEYEIDPEVQDRALSKIVSARDLFEEVFSEGDLHVFRVLDLKGTELQEERPSRDVVPAETDTVSAPVADFADLFSIESARVSPVSLAPGDSLTVHLLWKCLSPLPSEDVYKLFVRMDTGVPAGSFFAKSFDKPYRKLVERRIGKKLRFKVDVDPETCQPPLHLWKRGDRVEQVVTFTVPKTLFPGKYSVKANLRRTPASIDFHVSDYLRDEDYFSGIEIGSVLVRVGKTANVPVH